MKTAMQKAKEWLQIEKADKHTIEIFEEFEALEKEQIIDAYLGDLLAQSDGYWEKRANAYYDKLYKDDHQEDHEHQL